MVARSKRLQPIQKIAENREDAAAKEMGKARTQVNELETRLAELITFREEYARNFITAGEQGMGVSRMMEYQGFINRIDQAIAYQRSSIEQAKMVYENRKKIWGQLHGRVLAMDKLAARYRQQERMLADKRDQKETDERAQRTKHGKNEG